MDADALRKSMIRENQEKLTLEEKPEEEIEHDVEHVGDLPALLKNEAQKIQARFSSITRSGERHELETRYGQLDGWLGRLRELGALENREEAIRLQRELRGTVLDELQKWRGRGAPEREHLQNIEKDRKILREKAKVGGGVVAARRIKDEIDLLLKNYAPSNEAKIEALIDKWRRSGDPSYDPSIKLKLRTARRKKDSTINPL